MVTRWHESTSHRSAAGEGAPAGERWDAAKGAAVRAGLSASGESDRVCARRTGAAPHRISYWRKKLASGDRTERQSRRPGFVPARVVDAPPAPVTANEPREVEALLPRGVRLVFRGDWDRAALLPWLSVLGASEAE